MFDAITQIYLFNIYIKYMLVIIIISVEWIMCSWNKVIIILVNFPPIYIYSVDSVSSNIPCPHNIYIINKIYWALNWYIYNIGCLGEMFCFIFNWICVWRKWNCSELIHISLLYVIRADAAIWEALSRVNIYKDRLS